MNCAAQNGRNTALLIFVDPMENPGDTGTERRQEFEPLISSNER
jgi:hypothetical protein